MFVHVLVCKICTKHHSKVSIMWICVNSKYETNPPSFSVDRNNDVALCNKFVQTVLTTVSLIIMVCNGVCNGV